MSEGERKAVIEEAKRQAREEVQREMQSLRGEISDLRRKIDGASLYLQCDGTTLKGSITWGG